MSATNGKIPDLTIETVSRSFYREAMGYGFTQVDYVKFVNRLLDIAMQTNEEPGESENQGTVAAIDRDVTSVDVRALPLQGRHLAVRAFEPEKDLLLLDRWLADPSGRYFLLSRITSEQHDVREVVLSERSTLGIVTLPDSTPIGSVAFLNVDPVQRKAEIRKLIGEPTQRRKGFAKEASLLWIRYGLETMGLKKIYLNTLDTNIRNVKLNEELGFTVEGVLRNEVLIDGSYRDVLRMGLWRE